MKTIRKSLALFPALKTWLSLPAFVGMLGLSIGILLSDRLPVLSALPLYNHAILYSIIFGLIILIVFFRNTKARGILFIACGVLLHSSQTRNESLFYEQAKAVLAADNKTTLTGRVVSAPVLSKQRHSFLVSANRLSAGGESIDMHGRLLKCQSATPVPAYGAITCTGTFKAPRKKSNPYAFDEYAYLLSSRIWGRFTVDSVMSVNVMHSFLSTVFSKTRQTALNAISHVKDTRIQGILQASFLNENENLTSDVKQAFRDSGIYHLISISGFNVALLVSSVWLLLSIIPVSRTIKIVILVVFIWLYLFFVGLIPSLFRAVVMATIILLSFIFQRKNYALNSLGVAGILWLIISPQSLFTPGFQLSFVATLSIIILYPVFEDHCIPAWENAVANLTIKTILNAFFLSFACFIATLPVLVYHFGTISLLGLIANIFAVFLMGLGMNFFFAGIVAQALWEPLSIVLMKIAGFFLTLIIKTAELSSVSTYTSVSVPVPYPELIILFCLIFLGLAAVKKEALSRYCAWTVPVIFLVTPASILCRHLNPGSEITLFCDERANLTGIRFPNKKIWLIGSFSQEPSDQLYRNMIDPWMRHFMFKKFDAVLLASVHDNIIHTLDPVFSEITPKLVVNCKDLSHDDLLEDNFKSFLRNYTIKEVAAENGCRFIPADRCTCQIYCDNTGYHSNKKPAKIKLSLDKTQVYCNFSDTEIKRLEPEKEIVRITPTTALISSKNSKKQSLFKTEERAVTIKFGSNGEWNVE